MPESPDIPEDITAKIRSVMPYSLPSQEQLLPGQQADPDRNEPMPYQRPEGLLLIPGEDERGFAVTPVVGSTSGTIGSFVGQVSVSPDTLLNDFPAGMDGQTPILRWRGDGAGHYRWRIRASRRPEDGGFLLGTGERDDGRWRRG